MLGGAILTYNGVILERLLPDKETIQNITTVALSTNIALLGFPLHQSGIVYLFSLTNFLKFRNNNITISQKIQPDDANLNDYFGASLAFLTNETLLISSPFHQGRGYNVNL